MDSRHSSTKDETGFEGGPCHGAAGGGDEDPVWAFLGGGRGGGRGGAGLAGLPAAWARFALGRIVATGEPGPFGPVLGLTREQVIQSLELT